MKFRSMSFAAPMALALSMTMALAVAIPAMGFAAEAVTAPAGETAATARAPAVPAKEAKVAKKATSCEFGTGTRIRAGKPAGCDSTVLWRSYSKEEIDTTGYIDVAEALRHLDPIFH